MAFLAAAFQNDAFQLTGTAPPVVLPPAAQYGGAAGWVPGHKIKWSVKKKRPEQQVTEVAQAIAQAAPAVAISLRAEIDTNAERRAIAEILLNDMRISELRQIREAREMAALVERVIEEEIERDEESVVGYILADAERTSRRAAAVLERAAKAIEGKK